MNNWKTTIKQVVLFSLGGVIFILLTIFYFENEGLRDISRTIGTIFFAFALSRMLSRIEYIMIIKQHQKIEK